MPWCEDCSKFFPPNTLEENGECPDCHAVIGEPPKVPWHFKLLVVAVVLYLGFRAWQGIDWLVHHL
ncbi:MAG: hypothetical protein LC792_23790 [Actinobacteria bacterium]|nr:hypothetical protein [Actinomycetota bacterium]